VVVLATLWPVHATALRADDPDDVRRRPRYPDSVDILTERRIHECRLDTFSDTERATAARVAAQDPRIAAAVADRN
jgi:hypothetical protein